LPEAAQAAGDPGARTHALEAAITEHGITVEHVDDLDGAHGTSSGGRIRILNGLAPATEFSVLVHEYAHLCSAVGYVRSRSRRGRSLARQERSTFRRLVNTARLLRNNRQQRVDAQALEKSNAEKESCRML
jgi:hypothetical protein